MAETQTPNDISNILPQAQLNQPQQNLIQIPPQQQQQQQQPYQQQTFVVYAPQMYQPRQQIQGYNQVQPIQYPQFQQPQVYQPQQQQPILPYQYQQQQIVQPLIQKQNTKVTLKHEELRVAGKLERRYFNLQVLSMFLLYQGLAFVLCCCSYHNDFIKLSYNIYGSFKVTFYIFMIIMAISLLISFTSSKKLRDSQYSKILAAIYGISYAFFIQALYSSTYYYYYYYQYGYQYYFLDTDGGDAIVIICLSFINLQVLSLFGYCIQELDEISFKNSFWYLTLPALTYGGILFSMYNRYGILCGIIFASVAFGFYLQYILKRMLQSAKFNLRSDDGRYASVLLSFLIIAPFFDIQFTKSDEVVQAQRQNEQIGNVQ